MRYARSAQERLVPGAGPGLDCGHTIPIDKDRVIGVTRLYFSLYLCA